MRLDVPVPSTHFNPAGDIHYTTKEEMEAMLKDIDRMPGKHSKDKE